MHDVFEAQEEDIFNDLEMTASSHFLTEPHRHILKGLSSNPFFLSIVFLK